MMNMLMMPPKETHAMVPAREQCTGMQVTLSKKVCLGSCMLNAYCLPLMG